MRGLLLLNTVVRVFLTNRVTKRCRRCQFFQQYTKRNLVAVNFQVHDFYQWSIWWKRYQLELTQRVAQVKNSSGPVAFILCGPCKEHSEKEVSRKNNEGKGYGVRVVRTRIMVPSGSFRYTRFWWTLWMVYFDSSCQHSKVCYLMEMRSDSDEIIS